MRKIAIVTGASSGIGAAAAVALADRGVDVVLTFNRHQDRALGVAETIRSKGVRALPLFLDVGDSAAFAGFRDHVAQALEGQWGATKFDYLVNNAGFGQMAMFEDTTEELFDSFLRVLLKGPYFLTQALLPLLADGGAIVNVTSNASVLSGMEAGYSAYSAMKGGLDTLTRSLAKELSLRRIRVNAIAPGATRTRIGGDAFDRYPEIIGPITEKTAMGRVGEADDVGEVIAAVLSDEFRWVTGQTIEASGGARLSLSS